MQTVGIIIDALAIVANVAVIAVIIRRWKR